MAAFRASLRRLASGSSAAATSAAAFESSVLVEGSAQPLASLITQGPLFSRCSPAARPAAGAWEGAALDLEKWAAWGSVLSGEIIKKPAGESLTRAEAVRVYQYYLPVYFWVNKLLEAHRAAPPSGRGAEGPLVVGLSCPQGGGKTTIVDALKLLFSKEGKTCAEMSWDDFYLTHAEQVELARANPGNGLLELRGNPGSHDTGLLLDTLETLSDPDAFLAPGAEGAMVPRYDKSAFSGRGDRKPCEEWTAIPTMPDVVLLEGWCFGFRPLESESALKDDRLVPINQELQGAYRHVAAKMQAWIVVKVESAQCVYEWREQAEASMRAQGKPAMTQEQVKDFVDRYMPAYQHYLAGLYRHGPDTGEGKPLLDFQIDKGRNPVAQADEKPFMP